MKLQKLFKFHKGFLKAKLGFEIFATFAKFFVRSLQSKTGLWNFYKVNLRLAKFSQSGFGTCETCSDFHIFPPPEEFLKIFPSILKSTYNLSSKEKLNHNKIELKQNYFKRHEKWYIIVFHFYYYYYYFHLLYLMTKSHVSHILYI